MSQTTTKRIFLGTLAASAFDVGRLGRIQVVCAKQNQKLNHDCLNKPLYNDLTRQTGIQMNLIKEEAIATYSLNSLE